MADAYIDKIEVGAKIQMMYIRREMDYGGENDFCRGMRKALRIIENMPAADVQPIRRGRWELTNNPSFRKCSECGKKHDRDVTNFCPHCGADMRETKKG